MRLVVGVLLDVVDRLIHLLVELLPETDQWVEGSLLPVQEKSTLRFDQLATDVHSFEVDLSALAVDDASSILFFLGESNSVNRVKGRGKEKESEGLGLHGSTSMVLGTLAPG